ncbi:hypothetical protein DPEC_G00187290 [Dallia pectoralis]|uniref:Uncharacterized protein n=1 Tax=Dallia pectoralis TaxID=75939 RepID=A0ACC2GBT2_DALPE|nr:hypothetical protein DPEC_G00187290 [Dallia pectoralis]
MDVKENKYKEMSPNKTRNFFNSLCSSLCSCYQNHVPESFIGQVIRRKQLSSGVLCEERERYESVNGYSCAANNPVQNMTIMLDKEQCQQLKGGTEPYSTTERIYVLFGMLLPVWVLTVIGI